MELVIIAKKGGLKQSAAHVSIQLIVMWTQATKYCCQSRLSERRLIILAYCAFPKPCPTVFSAVKVFKKSCQNVSKAYISHPS